MAVKCNFCSGTPKSAVLTCENCSYHYCTSCMKKFHPKVGPLKNHNVVKASSAALNDTICNIHQSEKYSIFCDVCKILVCLKCVPEHAAHTLLNIEQATSQAKEQLESVCTRLNKTINHAAQVKQENDKIVSEMQDDARKAEEKINAEVEFLKNSIEDCQKSLINSLRSSTAARCGALEQTSSEIPELTQDSVILSNEISATLQSTSMHQLLKNYGALLSGAESKLAVLAHIDIADREALGFNFDKFDLTREVQIVATKLSPSQLNGDSLMTVTTTTGASDTSFLARTSRCSLIAEKPLSSESGDSGTRSKRKDQSRDSGSETIVRDRSTKETPELHRIEAQMAVNGQDSRHARFIASLHSKHPEFAPRTSRSLSAGGIEHHSSLRETGSDLSKPVRRANPAEDEAMLEWLKQADEQEKGKSESNKVIVNDGQKELAEDTDVSPLRRRLIEHRQNSAAFQTAVKSGESLIAPSARAVTQRAKESYYATYQLASDRQKRLDSVAKYGDRLLGQGRSPHRSPPRSPKGLVVQSSARVNTVRFGKPVKQRNVK